MRSNRFASYRTSSGPIRPYSAYAGFEQANMGFERTITGFERTNTGFERTNTDLSGLILDLSGLIRDLSGLIRDLSGLIRDLRRLTAGTVWSDQLQFVWFSLIHVTGTIWKTYSLGTLIINISLNGFLKLSRLCCKRNIFLKCFSCFHFFYSSTKDTQCGYFGPLKQNYRTKRCKMREI